MVLFLSALLTEPAYAEGWELRVGAVAGADASIGLKTQLPALGGDGAVSFMALHGRHGVQVELRDFWLSTRQRPAHLPGGSVSWVALWGEAPVHGYSTLGLGAFHSELLPALPMLLAEAGVERAGERLWLRAGPAVFTLPPFFVGAGLRLGVGVRF